MVVADSAGEGGCNSHQEWPVLHQDIPSSWEGRKERPGTFPRRHLCAMKLARSFHIFTALRDNESSPGERREESDGC